MVDLQFPQHLDGIHYSDVSVIEVVEGSQGEGRENPDGSLAQVGDEGLAAEQNWPDVADNDGLDSWKIQIFQI